MQDDREQPDDADEDSRLRKAQRTETDNAAAAEDEEQYGIDGHHQEAGQRRVAGEPEDPNEQQEGNDARPPVQEDHEAPGHRDPLAAVKAHVERKVMPQDHAEAGIQLQQEGQFGVIPPKDQPHSKEGQHHLAEVAEESENTGFRAHDAQRVGGPGIAAAVLTDIDPLLLRNQDARLKIAEKIADDDSKDASDHVCSFSFLSRMISLMLVPEKSKVSRI